MKTIINENQRGLMFKNGGFEKMLGAGKYITLGNKTIETLDIGQNVISAYCTLNTLLENNALSKAVDVIEVADRQLALHYVDGKFTGILKSGKYAFWKSFGKHEFTVVDISKPEVDAEVPEYIFTKIPQTYYIKVEVAEYQKARLYFNQKLVKILDSGTYYFWKNDTRVDVGIVDTRLTQLDIAGQEILTQDKVSLRINFVCNYKIADFVKIVTEIDNFEEQLHVAAQLALRDYVGKYRLDEILEKKEQMSAFVFEQLKAKENDLFITLYSADVKDIILPGEIRDIMNTVLIAEKKAQANVITRREEVSSTRSLLNTAKLMEENPTLYRLKELEYVERICENVGSINLNGNGDMLTQLAAILRGNGVSAK